jgi:hypothetical protein
MTIVGLALVHEESKSPNAIVSREPSSLESGQTLTGHLDLQAICSVLRSRSELHRSVRNGAVIRQMRGVDSEIVPVHRSRIIRGSAQRRAITPYGGDDRGDLTAAGKMKSTPSWSNVKSKLTGFDRAGLARQCGPAWFARQMLTASPGECRPPSVALKE